MKTKHEFPAHRTKLNTHFCEGTRLLWVLIEERGMGRNEIRHAAGVAAGVVTRWLYGDTRPSGDIRMRLRDAFDIPLESWTQPPTQVFIPPAARVAAESGPLPTTDGGDATGTEG